MLEINRYSHNTILIVELKGVLDSQSSADFRGWFEGQIGHGSIYIALDFLDVEYISSTGISVLLEVHSLVKQAEGHLVLFNLNSEIKSLFNFIKLDKRVFISLGAENAIDMLMQYKQDYPTQRSMVNANDEKTDILDKLTQEPNDRLAPEVAPEEELKNNVAEYPNVKKEENKIENPKIAPRPSTEVFNKTRLTQGKKASQRLEILICPNCKEKMKIKGEGNFMCPHCRNSIILN